MNRKSELIKCISTDLCRFAVIARRKIEVIAMTMTRFDDNARTVNIHEDGLMALVSSHLAPMSIKGLLRVHRPALLVCGKQLLSTCSIVSTQTGIF